MLYHLLNQLGRTQLPVFVSDPDQVKLIKRLLRAGYVDACLYPDSSDAKQFAQVVRVTPLGERVQAIFAHAGIRSESDIGHFSSRLPADLQRWTSDEADW